MYAEKMPFSDALWWSFVTCTTVGYGDLSPETTIGRVTAVILMMFGIGFLGMLTGSITTFFTNRIKTKSETKPDDLQALLDSATDEERQKIFEIAKIIVK